MQVHAAFLRSLRRPLLIIIIAVPYPYSFAISHEHFILLLFFSSFCPSSCLLLRAQWTIKRVFSQNPSWRSLSLSPIVTQRLKVKATSTAACAASCSPPLESTPGLFRRVCVSVAQWFCQFWVSKWTSFCVDVISNRPHCGENNIGYDVTCCTILSKLTF